MCKPRLDSNFYCKTRYTNVFILCNVMVVGLDLCLVMKRMWHFLELNCICETVAQERSWLMSSCKMRQSVELVIVQYRMQSSANNRFSDWMLLAMSLMYRRKRRGVRTVPCGTPDITGSQEDWEAMIITRCSRSIKVHARVLWRIPNDWSFTMSRLWGTESNALLKSKIAMSVRSMT